MHIDDYDKAGRLIKLRETAVRLREGAKSGFIHAEVHHGGKLDVFGVIEAHPIRLAIMAQAEACINDFEMKLADIGVTVAKPQEPA